MRKIGFGFLVLFFALPAFGQPDKTAPKGSLFIIGGGKRSPALMQTMLATAKLGPHDYIVVLPMTSEEPDTAFYYVKTSLQKLCGKPILNFNFTLEKQVDQQRIDSLTRAKLIFIAGGDQSRFMKVVLHTPIYAAIHKAFAAGATIAGTSAGAAVMSQHMITGNELQGDTAYHETFKKLWAHNIQFQEGLGLLQSAIIDQHFVVRSRYNRLLSALAAYPQLPCIGIDEETAIIVTGNKVRVTGNSQVIVVSHPQGLQVTTSGLIKFTDVQFHIYTAGDAFRLN